MAGKQTSDQLQQLQSKSSEAIEDRDYLSGELERLQSALDAGNNALRDLALEFDNANGLLVKKRAELIELDHKIADRKLELAGLGSL